MANENNEQQLDAYMASIFPPIKVPTSSMEEWDPQTLSFKSDARPNPKGTWKIHYRVFDVENDKQRTELEELQSDVFNGKVEQIFEETSWDKLGRFRVAMKWGTYTKN